MRYNFAADSFYIMKLCSRLIVLYCRSRPKDDKSWHFDPHFEEVRGGLEPWWMARWKARAEFLLSVIEILFYLTVEALQGKFVKTRCLQEWVGHLEPKFQGEEVVPGEYFFGFYKTRDILFLTITMANLNRFFTARRNARIASAVLATAIPSVRPSVCLSVRHTLVLCQNDGSSHCHYILR